MQTRRLLFKLNAATSEEDSLPGPWSWGELPFTSRRVELVDFHWRIQRGMREIFLDFSSFSSCCRTNAELASDGWITRMFVDYCDIVGFFFLVLVVDGRNGENDGELSLERSVLRFRDVLVKEVW